MKNKANKGPWGFAIIFIILFAAFFFFNKLFFSITQPGHRYNQFLAVHLNYIQALRWSLLKTSAQIISWLGYTVITNNYQLLVAGHGIIQIVYSCLGLGLMSFFAAFVLAYPKSWKPKITFLLAGIILIQLLNVIRFVVLALFWDKKSHLITDHHTIFNLIIYILIAVSLYFWIRQDNKPLNDAKNRPLAV